MQTTERGRYLTGQRVQGVIRCIEFIEMRPTDESNTPVNPFENISPDDRNVVRFAASHRVYAYLTAALPMKYAMGSPFKHKLRVSKVLRARPYLILALPPSPMLTSLSSSCL